MTNRPPTGSLVAYCMCHLTHHNCVTEDLLCTRGFGIVGIYMSTYTQDAVPVKSVWHRQWTITTLNRVAPAVWTFAGPILRTWSKTPW